MCGIVGLGAPRALRVGGVQPKAERLFTHGIPRIRPGSSEASF